MRPPSASTSETKRLHAELNRPDVRAQAIGVLRSLIEEIRLVPESGRLEIEVVGDLAGDSGGGGGQRKQPAVCDGGLRVILVAGTGFEPVTFRL